MRRITLTHAVCVSCFFVVLPAVAAALPIESTFDSDLDGWTDTAGSQVSWASSGGNPGGYLRFEDAVGTSGFVSAPSKFLGDWLSLDGTGELSFDHKIFDPGSNPDVFHFEVFVSGPGGSARFTEPHPIGPDGTTATATSWIHVSALLDESLWSVESGTWLGLLADVDLLHVRAEMVTNVGGNFSDIDGLDNIRLVPEPSTAGLMLVGLLPLALGARRRHRMK